MFGFSVEYGTEPLAPASGYSPGVNPLASASGSVPALIELRPQDIDRRANCLLHEMGFLITLVRITRPEKTSQAILPATRYNMHVQVRNTLAHAIIHRDKRAVRLHPGF